MTAAVVLRSGDPGVWKSAEDMAMYFYASKLSAIAACRRREIQRRETSASRETQPRPSTSRETQPRPSSSRETQPRPTSSRESQPRPSTSREPQPSTSAATESSSSCSGVLSAACCCVRVRHKSRHKVWLRYKGSIRKRGYSRSGPFLQENQEIQALGLKLLWDWTCSQLWPSFIETDLNGIGTLAEKETIILLWLSVSKN